MQDFLKSNIEAVNLTCPSLENAFQFSFCENDLSHIEFFIRALLEISF